MHIKLTIRSYLKRNGQEDIDHISIGKKIMSLEKTKARTIT